jgi:hypothetical protein
MRELGSESREPGRAYLVGGATAVLMGWRDSTIDVDLKLEPDSEPLLRAITVLKERLELNVELASPDHFIPELPGWRERSPFVAREGQLDFHHYDLYAQALAKIERGHVQDVQDVDRMLTSGAIDSAALLARFRDIEPSLYRFPAVDAPSFRAAVEELVASRRSS